jgi:pimeloyl-ACP methyl ester carboxylesterase
MADLRLVCLHGLGRGPSDWDAVRARLSAHGTVMAPVLPRDPAAALAAAGRAVAPGTVLVGHSMGGIVALRLAIRRPDLVRALVLAAAAGISTGSRAAEVFLTAVSLLKPGRRIALYRDRIATSPRLRSLAFDGFSTSDGAALSETATTGFLSGSRLYTDIASAGRALAREDVRLDLARLSCPALVLWGARDKQVPLDDAFEYARRLGAPLRTIADCGHLLIGERPEACADAVERFLDGLR